MAGKKYCFMNKARVCDLTCKAAFEVDDPVDNVDCSFVWLSFHAGEALFELRQVLENMRGLGGGLPTKPKGKPFGQPFQLFDLERDLGEERDVAAEHPGVVVALRAELEALRAAGRSRPAAAR